MRFLITIILFGLCKIVCASSNLLKFDTMIYDFGEVNKKSISHTFKITNISSNEVLISDIISSCKCLTTSLDKKNLSTNETVNLTLNLTTRGLTGALLQSIFLQVDTSAGKMSYILSLKGTLANKLQLLPATLNFHNSKNGKTKKLTIKSVKDTDLSLSEIIYDKKLFTIDKSVTNRKLVLNVTLKSQLITRTQQFISLKFKDKLIKTLKIPVILPDSMIVSWNPYEFDFKKIKLNQHKKLTVKIKNVKNKTIVIKSVQIYNGGNIITTNKKILKTKLIRKPNSSITSLNLDLSNNSKIVGDITIKIVLGFKKIKNYNFIINGFGILTTD